MNAHYPTTDISAIYYTLLIDLMIIYHIIIILFMIVPLVFKKRKMAAVIQLNKYDWTSEIEN